MDLTKIDKPFGDLDRETKIALFTAWVDGDGLEHYSSMIGDWVNSSVPSWGRSIRYRKAAPTEPSIDWDHVAPQFKWMATDDSGTTMLYEEKPRLSRTEWEWAGGDCANITALASFRAGTCDWKDSLVQRPE